MTECYGEWGEIDADYSGVREKAILTGLSSSARSSWSGSSTTADLTQTEQQDRNVKWKQQPGAPGWSSLGWWKAILNQDYNNENLLCVDLFSMQMRSYPVWPWTAPASVFLVAVPTGGYHCTQPSLCFEIYVLFIYLFLRTFNLSDF